MPPQRPTAARKRPAKKSPSSSSPPGKDRLQKVLAAAGIGSRRQCEELISAGRVEVDRAVVTRLGTTVDAEHQEIRVDGTVLPRSRRAYYAVHKPRGVVTTHRDPSGRPRVIDFVPSTPERLFPVGRLDMYSDGLILLTNDGELANMLTHPRYEVEKTYRVLVAGEPTPEVLAKLKQGTHLAEGVAKVHRIQVKKRLRQSTLMELTLREGRNREIRRILARVGHKVLRLTRIAVGPVRLGNLPVGAHRKLTHDEVEGLRQSIHRRGVEAP
jgi:23S rRNA pseudouridine2605 synthase